jgi:hypothetical protein
VREGGGRLRGKGTVWGVVVPSYSPITMVMFLRKYSVQLGSKIVF